MAPDGPSCAELSAKLDQHAERIRELHAERMAAQERIIAALKETIRAAKLLQVHADGVHAAVERMVRRNELDETIRELDPGHRGSDPQSPATPEEVTRLEGRLRVVTELGAWRIRRRVESAGGLARFGLTDDILVPARESIAAAGGITAEHDAAMGRPRRLSAGPNAAKLGRPEPAAD